MRTRPVRELETADQPMTYSGTLCVRCKKPLQAGTPFTVHIINGGSDVLHPADAPLYSNEAADCGYHPIGATCALRFGLEWCHTDK